MNGHEECITSLVRLRADINAKDHDGRTALHHVSCCL